MGRSAGGHGRSRRQWQQPPWPKRLVSFEDGDGTLKYAEFVVGLLYINSKVDALTCMRLTFSLFDANADGKVHFMRVNGSFQEDGRYHVVPVGAQGSHQLAATANADAMAVVPDGSGVIAGGEVAVLLLR